MLSFSANLGFLWGDKPLCTAIRFAAAAGFSAVECHWPYDVAPAKVKAALQDTGLPMLGLNTRRGDVQAAEMGLTALPGRSDEARAAIEQAIAYATAIGASAVHVMAGNATGPAAHDQFITNLRFATRLAEDQGLTILIEPLNHHDAPAYFLRTTRQACEIIAEVAAPNLKLMFDCYHVGRTERAVIPTLREVLPMVGHIQFAAVPDRGPPDHGEVDYTAVFAEIRRLGWQRPLGAEYRPPAEPEASLGWMKSVR